MRRLSLLVGAFVLVSSIASAQIPISTFSFQGLDLGRIYAKPIPVELNGSVGSEYLLRTHPWAPTFAVLYPGRCVAGTITYDQATDTILDWDGDGRVELLRFDMVNQTATLMAFPVCPTE